MVDHWVLYREFMFEGDRAEVHTSDTAKVTEIAAYIQQNPSLQLGIDGTPEQRGSDPRDRNLCDRRAAAVSDALRQAGVPAGKISTGAFGDAQLRRDRRVAVLIRTGSADVGAMVTSEFARPRSWQKGTDLSGTRVMNHAGEDLGKLEDLVIDADSGRVMYGVLSFGGFLGIGEKLYAIPWSCMHLSNDRKSIVLNVDKEDLENATGFDKGNWPNFADEQFATAIYKHYNQTPYWWSQRHDGGRRATPYRDRWNQRTTAWQKASDLSAKDVRNAQNQNLGKTSDLAIDSENGRVLYGIVSYKGKLFAVPWNALNLTQDARHFELDVDEARLNNSVSFGKDNWPSMTNERWGNETHAYYNVEPYWNDRPIRGQSDSSGR